MNVPEPREPEPAWVSDGDGDGQPCTCAQCRPRCHRHDVWMASCTDCAEQHRVERERAQQ